MRYQWKKMLITTSTRSIPVDPGAMALSSVFPFPAVAVSGGGMFCAHQCIADLFCRGRRDRIRDLSMQYLALERISGDHNALVALANGKNNRTMPGAWRKLHMFHPLPAATERTTSALVISQAAAFFLSLPRCLPALIKAVYTPLPSMSPIKMAPASKSSMNTSLR